MRAFTHSNLALGHFSFRNSHTIFSLLKRIHFKTISRHYRPWRENPLFSVIPAKARIHPDALPAPPERFAEASRDRDHFPWPTLALNYALRLTTELGQAWE